MNNLKTITPFKCLCMTIGNLPTAYFESMSYYECLTFLVKFLQNQVIPTVNNNSNVVAELQDYVSHYFDNLDVQEEINNKLDEMAQGGELVQIIGAYFNAYGFVGFNTKADMVASQNLINGSKCKTLGTNTYNDGLGETYLIRTITQSDVIDGANKVALTNLPTLLAERIPNYYNTLLNISNFEETELIGTVNVAEIKANSGITLATNADQSIFKLYGYIKFTASSTGNATITLDTNLVSDTQYQMSNVAICYNANNLCNTTITVKTNGNITVDCFVVDSTQDVFLQLPANLYFNKDFGD